MIYGIWFCILYSYFSVLILTVMLAPREKIHNVFQRNTPPEQRQNSIVVKKCYQIPLKKQL